MTRFVAVFLSALSCLAAPAAAGPEWRYLPGGSEAAIRGGPVGLGVGCGVEGPGVWVELPDQDPQDRRFVIGTDLGGSWPATGLCAGGVCLLVLDDEHETPLLVDDLRRGRTARVALDGGAELGEVSLRGSGQAIGRVLEDCPF